MRIECETLSRWKSTDLKQHSEIIDRHRNGFYYEWGIPGWGNGHCHAMPNNKVITCRLMDFVLVPAKSETTVAEIICSEGNRLKSIWEANVMNVIPHIGGSFPATLSEESDKGQRCTQVK